ncbi:MAG: hypothetical protein FWD59_01090, partial [Micrococcales bacterium]|nr:hypothetical protein [Micrococcales bacterium]
MSQHAHPVSAALGGCIAALALAVGGMLPATATPDSTDGATRVAADCDTFETACPWDLTPLSVSPVGQGLVYLAFTAPSSGPFRLSSSNRTGGDPYGILYDSARHLIASDDDSAGNLNFLILADLVEGEEYYLAVRHLSSSSSGSFTVNFAEGDPCSTLAAACLWDLTPRAVTFTGRSRVYLRFIAPATDGFR